MANLRKVFTKLRDALRGLSDQAKDDTDQAKAVAPKGSLTDS